MSDISGIEPIKAKCCVVGGGPAGMMLGFLLARAGIEVLVMEKHGDFLRDFRGDTVHPSTLQIMNELGILDELLERPHHKEYQLGAELNGEELLMADFSHLPEKIGFIAFMPQWEFLNFLSEKAKAFPQFRLEMNTEATGIIEEAGRVVGVKAKTKSAEVEVRADVVFGADGRGSVIRKAAGLEVRDLGAPMDVLWFRLSLKETDPAQTLGRIRAAALFISINRGDYWQCGFMIPKGNLEKMKLEGLDAFRKRITVVAPFLSDRMDELAGWDDVKLLTVKVDRLTKWYREGLLCIGDSAHAMSPIGGVGINLAIQDAVATANILYESISRGHCSEQELKKVQDWRMYPTRMTQRLQLRLQESFVKPTLEATKQLKFPWFLHLFKIFPILRTIPAEVIGMGFRPEHIKIPAVSKDE